MKPEDVTERQKEIISILLMDREEMSFEEFEDMLDNYSLEEIFVCYKIIEELSKDG